MPKLYRLIAPGWLFEENPGIKRVIEGELSDDEVLSLNEVGYNVYYLPNRPSIYEGGTVSGHQVDKFDCVFIDMDLKEGRYKSKQDFVTKLQEFKLPPTMIVDSGGGVHAYWRISDLDVMGYLRLSRRLMRYFDTDEAVGQIYQLMRCPDTINTKDKNNFKICQHILKTDEVVYSSEQLDKALPALSFQDEQYTVQHYSKTYNILDVKVDDKIPLKFAKLLSSNNEVSSIWKGGLEDRSKGDFRLGHIMFASGFDKAEATSVLVNSPKALARAPIHRINYATGIVDKIWTFESEVDKSSLDLSSSVRDIINKAGSSIKGTRLPCWSYFDDTLHGFRLGQVIGLVAGSGVGKTAVALNMFLGFVQNNPDYDHFFVPLEQPANEIADRWKTMCGGREYLYEKVHVISNYDESGAFRHLSFSDIRDYILKFQKVTGRKVGSVVIDHIGALKKKGKDGENQDLMQICHEMKAFAVQTNSLLVMQSQAPREKAGIGDLELSKDAAYGTVYFESYCDYLITLWQPLKRCYAEGAPTVTAYKFCKIRHKKQGEDRIKEDVCYKVMFDSKTEHLREMTQDEDKSFTFFLSKATNKRKLDRKTDLVSYESIKTA